MNLNPPHFWDCSRKIHYVKAYGYVALAESAGFNVELNVRLLKKINGWNQDKCETVIGKSKKAENSKPEKKGKRSAKKKHISE